MAAARIPKINSDRLGRRSDADHLLDISAINTVTRIANDLETLHSPHELRKRRDRDRDASRTAVYLSVYCVNDLAIDNRSRCRLN